MRSKLLLAAIILSVFVGSFLAKGMLGKPQVARETGAGRPRRIVSLGPGVTEILFALGAGDRVVGVTPFCKFPPEAQRLPKVGGFLDPNFEVILKLQPDLVVLRESNQRSQPALRELGLRCAVVSHRRLEEVLDSLIAIGEAIGEQARARLLLADIRRRIAQVQKQVAGRKRPRVLLSIYRVTGSGKLEAVTVAAADGYFDRIIEIAGGQNACRGSAAPFPQLSHEGIFWMKPDVIVDIVRPMAETGLDRQKIAGDWQSFPEIPAVAGGRVYVIDDDFASIPGPRSILLIEKLARLLHPEVDWP